MVMLNCINEALGAVADWEFDTRVGVDKSAAKKLRTQLRQARTDFHQARECPETSQHD